MGISERKEREKIELRQSILQAAKDLFVANGYDKVSIRNIAERVEYSPATIYLYFKDKDDILLAVHDDAFRKLFVTFEPLREIENPLDRLREMGRTYLQFAFENQDLYDLMFIMREPMNAICRDEEEWEEGFNSYYLLRNTIQEAVDKKLLRNDNVDIMTVTTFAQVHGLASLHIRGRFKMLPTEAVESIIHQAVEYVISLMSA